MASGSRCSRQPAPLTEAKAGNAPSAAKRSSSNHNPDGFILHPTWQKVRRNYVFNEEGKIIQFTVLWHDMEGNLCSDIVNVPELPELFLASGFEPEDFAMQEPCFHLTPFKGELYPTSISGSG
jgi:hypothetical protein